jgi:ERCC4-type nuclease
MDERYIDYSERGAALPGLTGESGLFVVQMGRLPTGDYLIDDSILVERKAYVDFVASIGGSWRSAAPSKAS